MTRRNLIFIIGALLIVGCAGSGDENIDDTNSPSPGPAVSMTIEGFSFGDPLQIAVGQELIVTNLDTLPHTWTSEDDLFDSGSLARDAEFSFTFQEPGEYGFICTIHPTMTGTVTVTG